MYVQAEAIYVRSKYVAVLLRTPTHYCRERDAIERKRDGGREACNPYINIHIYIHRVKDGRRERGIHIYTSIYIYIYTYMYIYIYI